VLVQLNSSVASGSGGNGGNGGTGAPGGRGGAGGTGGLNGVPRLGAGGHGGAGGSGGGGGLGGAGAGGPSYSYYVVDSTSIVRDIPGAATFTAGIGGVGGVSGASGGSPQHAPDGASGPCSGSCPSQPIIVPAVALLKGHQITTEFQCHTACHGTASLHFIPTSSTKSAGAALSQLSFSLHGKGVTTVHMTLKPSALASLAHSQRLAVQLTIVVSVGGSRPSTFVSSLELTRKLPPRPPKAKKTARASNARRA
jgi:hypothetical protein